MKRSGEARDAGAGKGKEAVREVGKEKRHVPLCR